MPSTKPQSKRQNKKEENIPVEVGEQSNESKSKSSKWVQTLTLVFSFINIVVVAILGYQNIKANEKIAQLQYEVYVPQIVWRMEYKNSSLISFKAENLGREKAENITITIKYDQRLDVIKCVALPPYDQSSAITSSLNEPYTFIVFKAENLPVGGSIEINCQTKEIPLLKLIEESYPDKNLADVLRSTDPILILPPHDDTGEIVPLTLPLLPNDIITVPPEGTEISPTKTPRSVISTPTPQIDPRSIPLYQTPTSENNATIVLPRSYIEFQITANNINDITQITESKESASEFLYATPSNALFVFLMSLGEDPIPVRLVP